MKSSGLFPHKRALSRGNVAGGSAGNSSGSGKDTSSDDGYRKGMKGWQSGRSGGGQSMSQAMKNNPAPYDSSLSGVGGLAYDRSASRYMEDAGRPADAYAETRKSK